MIFCSESVVGYIDDGFRGLRGLQNDLAWDTLPLAAAGIPRTFLFCSVAAEHAFLLPADAINLMTPFYTLL